jgi:hypothetical protein
MWTEKIKAEAGGEAIVSCEQKKLTQKLEKKQFYENYFS